METDDIIIINDRITTRAKIKEGTGTILEGTLEEEIFIEETITEGTIVEVIQTMTTKMIFFNNMIIKMLRRH